MTPTQIQIVQDSFALVQPAAKAAASLFYGRLFELDPSLRPMFKGDLESQGKMLMAMIGTAVGSLRDVNKLVPVLHSLGARHSKYGVEDHHYDTVGVALLWTLEQGLGDTFTPRAREAWAAAYGLLSRTMQAGAAQSVEA